MILDPVFLSSELLFFLQKSSCVCRKITLGLCAFVFSLNAYMYGC